MLVIAGLSLTAGNGMGVGVPVIVGVREMGLRQRVRENPCENSGGWQGVASGLPVAWGAPTALPTYLLVLFRAFGGSTIPT